MPTYPMPICVDCKHLNRDEDATILDCTAFPKGIPDAIIEGRHDHRVPSFGDHGIRFEARADAPLVVIGRDNREGNSAPPASRP